MNKSISLLASALLAFSFSAFAEEVAVDESALLIVSTEEEAEDATLSCASEEVEKSLDVSSLLACGDCDKDNK